MATPLLSEAREELLVEEWSERRVGRVRERETGTESSHWKRGGSTRCNKFTGKELVFYAELVKLEKIIRPRVCLSSTRDTHLVSSEF